MTASGASRFTIERYDPGSKPGWDDFIRASKNGTFLLLRDYMDYHSDRFEDFSLLIRDGAGIAALVPANRVGTELHSHGGLTYGGVISSDSMTTPGMLDVFEVMTAFLRGNGISRLLYKTVPSIYHRIPAEEDRYALFRADAHLYRRDVLTVVPLANRPTVQTRRLRGAARAKKHDLTVSRSDRWADYWAILTEHLQARFGVNPVHTLAEIELLRDRFPDNIKLYAGEADGQVLAGIVMFESPTTAHAQYIVSSERGREIGALDAVFLHLLVETYRDKPFFDFGISNEEQGRILNRGLIEQKEGFGGRAVVHDYYAVEL